MMSLIRSLRDHWRRNPIESAAIVGLGAGAVALVALAGYLPFALQIVLWMALLAGLILVGRMFGPVLFYDLVRSARRLRFILVRTLYALLLAFVIAWIYFVVVYERRGRMAPVQMSQFANTVCYTFLVIQFITVVLLTPAYTAGAIAEEKERKTLEFILATDLDNREIVLGKAVSRLMNLSLLLLAGLPILGFLQLLGGVDFVLVLGGFAATALTMYSLAGLSLFNSVLCRRARDAIVLTYLIAVGYLMLANAAWGFLAWATLGRGWPELATFPSTAGWTSPLTVQDLVDGFNAGNIFQAVFRLGSGSSATAVFQQELPRVLGGYALFHVLVGSVFLLWSVVSLRSASLREKVARTARPKGARRSIGHRRPVGRHPMIWKEVFAEGGLRMNAAGRIIAGVLVLASLLPAVMILWLYQDGSTSWRRMTQNMNAIQMRTVGTTIATLMLLAVVVRAAGSIRGEREKNTFDDLLTTRLTNREILFGKWLGAVLSVRWAWLWLGSIWLVTLLSGGVTPFALPLILVAWVVYAVVAAGIGLWFSIGARSSLRATVAALATALFAFGGHWLVTLTCCIIPVSIVSRGPGSDMDWVFYMQAGQSPPFVMGLFAFQGDEFGRGYGGREMTRLTAASVFGVVSWAALVPLLWLGIKRRFERTTGREAELLPERESPHPRRPSKRALIVDAEEPMTVLPVEEENEEEASE
jgi:ABC-type transport system involved in multi-copper enzyme maturation permease subunit